MIEYLTITIIALAQIGLYLWMDKRAYRLSKIWMLLVFLAGQVFVFPEIVLSTYQLNGEQCGMPIVALHLFFIILGGGLNLITHLTYYLIKRNKLKQKL